MNSNISRKDFFKLTAGSIFSILLLGNMPFATEVALATTPNSFVREICEEARDIAAEKEIHASVMLAQAIIESGSGTSGLGKAPNYNLFGIKGSGTAGSVVMSTAEDDGSGNYFTINSAFRKYNSWFESMEDYADLIKSNQGYRGAWLENTGGDYHKATSALQGNYATSTSYASALNSTISNYGLEEYDKARNYSIDNVRMSMITSYSKLSLGEVYNDTKDFIIDAYKNAYNIDIDERLSQFNKIEDSEYRISDVIKTEDDKYYIYIGQDFVSCADNKVKISEFKNLSIKEHLRYKECYSEEERHAMFVEEVEEKLKTLLDKDLANTNNSITNELKDLYDFDGVQ